MSSKNLAQDSPQRTQSLAEEKALAELPPRPSASSAVEAPSEDVVVAVESLSKMYHLYDRPQDRLKQAFLWGWKQYYREFWALRNVSFQVKRGEVLGIIGRNGSGKSTLLQMLAGVLKPTTGRAEVRGRVAALLELGSGFNPEFTGRENVYMNAAILGLTKEEIDARYDTIAQFAEIGQFIEQPVKTYSSGMYMRLAFAISAHVDADILVVDEALSVGDAAFQFKCMARLESLLSQGVTVLLVSHSIQTVKGYCTSALYLRKGELAYFGDCETATELYLMEMSGEQKAHLATKLQFKAPVSEEAGLHVGSEAGQILGVAMGCGPTERSYVNSGERAWLNVRAHVSPEVKRPRITMAIRDLNGYNLYVFNNLSANCGVTPDRDGQIAGRFSFNCNLKPGDYLLTVRLSTLR